MFDSIAAVRFLFPGYFQLAIPSEYNLNVSGRHAMIALEKRISPIEVLDFTNEMIPDPEREGKLYTLKNPIPSPSKESQDFALHLYPIQKGREVIEKAKGKNSVTPFPHHLTIDFPSTEVKRFYKTRRWTLAWVFYEAENGEEISDPEFNFFLGVFEYFIRAYRVIQKDPLIFSFEEVQEPLFRMAGIQKFSEEELSLSPEERLRKPRKIPLPRNSVYIPAASEMYFGTDEKLASQKLKNFFTDNLTPSLAEELLIRARYALRIHHFRYAVLDAFTAVETVVTSILDKLKLEKGVSKQKIDDYANEVGIAYKINIEVPAFFSPISDDERSELGNVNRLRKLRNEIIHTGRFPTKEEAEESLACSGKLLDMFSNRGFSLK